MIRMKETGDTPMMLSLRQAAEEAGVDKMTISRAIKSGKLSAGRESKQSPFQIDPSELARVFPCADKKTVSETSQKDTVRRSETQDNLFEIRLLRRELELRDKEIEMIETERRRERGQLTDTIDDLKSRLTDTSNERNRLTHILTDQTQRKKPFIRWFKRI